MHPRASLAAGCQPVAFVVPDITGAETIFCRTMGIERFCRFDHFGSQITQPTYRGAPGEFDYHLSIAYAGDMQIELIQNLYGSNIYSEYNDVGARGVHHLGFILEDYDGTVADFTAGGHPVVQGGWVGGSRFAYFDTRAELGVFTEIIVPDAEGREMFARIKRGEF